MHLQPFDKLCYSDESSSSRKFYALGFVDAFTRASTFVLACNVMLLVVNTIVLYFSMNLSNYLFKSVPGGSYSSRTFHGLISVDDVTEIDSSVLLFDVLQVVVNVTIV